MLQLTISPITGIYSKPQKIVFLANSEATIHYTTDGRSPTPGTPYTSSVSNFFSFIVDSNKTIRAIAVTSSEQSSEVIASYKIQEITTTAKWNTKERFENNLSYGDVPIISDSIELSSNGVSLKPNSRFGKLSYIYDTGRKKTIKNLRWQQERDFSVFRLKVADSKDELHQLSFINQTTAAISDTYNNIIEGDYSYYARGANTVLTGEKSQVDSIFGNEIQLVSKQRNIGSYHIAAPMLLDEDPSGTGGLATFGLSDINSTITISKRRDNINRKDGNILKTAIASLNKNNTELDVDLSKLTNGKPGAIKNSVSDVTVRDLFVSDDLFKDTNTSENFEDPEAVALIRVNSNQFFPIVSEQIGEIALRPTDSGQEPIRYNLFESTILSEELINNRWIVTDTTGVFTSTVVLLPGEYTYRFRVEYHNGNIEYLSDPNSNITDQDVENKFSRIVVTEPTTKVFRYSNDEAKTVQLIGDFNQFDETANVMHQQLDITKLASIINESNYLSNTSEDYHRLSFQFPTEKRIKTIRYKSLASKDAKLRFRVLIDNKPVNKYEWSFASEYGNLELDGSSDIFVSEENGIISLTKKNEVLITKNIVIETRCEGINEDKKHKLVELLSDESGIYFEPDVVHSNGKFAILKNDPDRMITYSKRVSTSKPFVTPIKITQDSYEAESVINQKGYAFKYVPFTTIAFNEVNNKTIVHCLNPYQVEGNLLRIDNNLINLKGSLFKSGTVEGVIENIAYNTNSIELTINSLGIIGDAAIIGLELKEQDSLLSEISINGNLLVYRDTDLITLDYNTTSVDVLVPNSDFTEISGEENDNYVLTYKLSKAILLSEITEFSFTIFEDDIHLAPTSITLVLGDKTYLLNGYSFSDKLIRYTLSNEVFPDFIDTFSLQDNPAIDTVVIKFDSPSAKIVIDEIALQCSFKVVNTNAEIRLNDKVIFRQNLPVSKTMDLYKIFVYKDQLVQFFINDRLVYSLYHPLGRTRWFIKGSGRLKGDSIKLQLQRIDRQQYFQRSPVTIDVIGRYVEIESFLAQ